MEGIIFDVRAEKGLFDLLQGTTGSQGEVVAYSWRHNKSVRAPDYGLGRVGLVWELGKWRLGTELEVLHLGNCFIVNKMVDSFQNTPYFL